MKTNRNYFGIDASKEISLYEYGMLVKRINKTDYYVIYGVDTDESGMTYTGFNDSFKTDNEVNELLNESWFDKTSFLSCVGMEENDWKELNIATKLHDLIQYYGSDNIFSTGYSIYTAKQIAFKTKIACPTF